MSSKEKVKKDIDLDQMDKRANTIDLDYKAKLVAASLVEQGYDIDRTIITREGADFLLSDDRQTTYLGINTFI